MRASGRTGADIARLRRMVRADVPATPFDRLTMAVVGARHENPRRKGQPTGNRQTEILLCERGEPIELRPEPDNPHDAAAIAVYSARGVQLGYLSADRTALIHGAHAGGRSPRAIFQEATPWGCWIRVGLGIEPMLPTATVRPGQRARSVSDDAWDCVDWLPSEDDGADS